jgi:hypothetical protein
MPLTNVIKAIPAITAIPAGWPKTLCWVCAEGTTQLGSKVCRPCQRLLEKVIDPRNGSGF